MTKKKLDFVQLVWDMLQEPNEEALKLAAAKLMKGQGATVEHPALVRVDQENFDAAVAALSELPPGMRRRIKIALKTQRLGGTNGGDESV